MKRIVLTLICLVSIQLSYAQTRVRIKSDANTYLSVCTGCQRVVNANSGQFNTATLHMTTDNDWFTHYTMTRLANGNYVFKNERGQYMSICSGCIVRGAKPDFVTFHTTTPEPWAQFRVRRLSNGKYSIQSVHNGKYIARCNGCSPTYSKPNVVTAHATNPEVERYAQWDIEIY